MDHQRQAERIFDGLLKKGFAIGGHVRDPLAEAFNLLSQDLNFVTTGGNAGSLRGRQPRGDERKPNLAGFDFEMRGDLATQVLPGFPGGDRVVGEALTMLDGGLNFGKGAAEKGGMKLTKTLAVGPQGRLLTHQVCEAQFRQFREWWCRHGCRTLVAPSVA